MDDTVPLLDVLHVLQAHGVTTTKVRGNTYTVEGNGILEETVFLNEVNRKRLHSLSRKFEIAIHLFWHPELCPSITDSNIQ